ncbi:MAG: hypothetical protein ACLGI5_08090 [Thermoleophilia bacterium]
MTGADAPRWSTAAQPALGVGPDGPRTAGRDDFYDHLLHVCLLLLLEERASTSADVRDRLRPLGFEQTTTAVDTALQALSDAGLVLLANADGDAPVAYAATAEGSAWLRGATQELRRTELVLGGFLARCGDRLLSLS